MASTRAVLILSILFAVVSSPQTYIMLDTLIGRVVGMVSPGYSGPNLTGLFNSSNNMGLLLQTLVFAIVVSQFA